MIANSHGTAKRGEKRHWQYVVPLERGKLHGHRLRLNRQRRRLYNWETLSSSFSWVSFLGCLQQCSVLFIKATYSRETRRCGVQREERIVYAFAWFRNWLHQDCSMFNKPLQQKYGRQRNYTSIPSAFSLAKDLNLLLKHRNCRVTSQVGNVLSIQFGDNYVVWSEANYYYSCHLAKKVMLKCIIQPINSWIKITRKITFIGLAVQ